MRSYIALTGMILPFATALSATAVRTGEGTAVVAEPADGSLLSEISAIGLEFPGAAAATWDYGTLNTATAPWLEYDGIRVGTYTVLGGEGNCLTMDFTYDGYSGPGEYTVYVQSGTYMIDGEPGEPITLHYRIAETGVDTVGTECGTVTVIDSHGRTVLENASPEALKGLRGFYIVNGTGRILR